MWLDALGGEAGYGSGHALKFTETMETGRTDEYPEWCTDNSEIDNRKWNFKLPRDTLIVRLPGDTGEGSWANLGYFARPLDGQENAIAFNGEDKVQPFEVAHEIGHVLGLAHEHVRDDRDHYVLYNCRNVVDYMDKLTKMWKKDLNLDITDLCNNLDVANDPEIDFMGSQFIKGHTYNRGKASTQTVNYGTYDMHSIMHYPSVTFSGFEECRADATLCPLAAYKNSEDHSEGVTWVPLNGEISDGDKDRIRSWYPYMYPPAADMDERVDGAKSI
ncbi:hypothetical protein BCR34DRAFT_561359 [Clohesyomyces aquaticus]|uniref:Metalloendopeptidase n=1 Tax=Clohesyomyces aquaticus TaxID=1231657 RepID=A0A1Y1ZUA0_9PLEO|nr:hypothetical protein BCR34DRAFT_561359 [Clohesyomyces aquaticus]